jgi:hypothetical protein
LVARSSVVAIFKPADLDAILAKVRAEPLDGTDLSAAAKRLNEIVEGYISTAHREAAPTAGERRDEYRSAERDILKALAHFSVANPIDHLNSNDTINALNTLFLGIPGTTGIDAYLRNALAKEAGASGELGHWHAMRLAVRGMQLLLHNTRVAADAAEREKGAHRRKPHEELNLVAQVRNLYVEITGDRKRYTIDVVNDVQGSRLVDVIAEVARHIHEHPGLVELPVPPSLRGKLRALYSTPRRIIERLRQLEKRP